MFPWIMWFTYFFYLEVQITTDASHSKQLISILVHLSVEVILNLMIDIGARVGFMIYVYKNMIFVYCTSNYLLGTWSLDTRPFLSYIVYRIFLYKKMGRILCMSFICTTTVCLKGAWSRFYLSNFIVYNALSMHS